MKNALQDLVKLSVFVGSPKRELENVRLRIIQAILEDGHIPDGMELWAAHAEPTLDTIRAKLQSCDVHVIILGSQYGQRLKDQEISFTEWEYIQSREAKRPVISFLLDEPVFKQAWETNPPKGGEQEQKAYLRLWSELSSDRACKFYPSIEMPGIEKDVVRSLKQVATSEQLKPHAGWVRAESPAAKLAATLQGNPFLLRVMHRVASFRTTGSRLEKEGVAKKAAAELFWDLMANKLERAGYLDLFLESGSSLTNVSEALESNPHRQKGWKIATNNALSLLQLILFTDGEVRRNPPVAPDPRDPYGAIFTRKCLDAAELPHTTPRALYPKEMEAVREIVRLITTGTKKQLILATSSGWDTTCVEPAFHGPHVGSHANMLFKRALFMTGQPVVLFLSRRKVDPGFREARYKCRVNGKSPDRGMSYCYPVFGEELTLAQALANTPLAICVGYEQESGESVDDFWQTDERLKSILGPALVDAGFDLEYGAKEFDWKDGTLGGAIMVANEKFCQLFPR